jgi:hypothetical protein
MKFLPLLMLGSAMLLGGCASTENGAKPAAVNGEESYVALGSNIPRKGARRPEDQGIDLQQLDNARTTNNGVTNGGQSVR